MEALASGHHDAIDLVLTDMVMPEGMSGMDLAQKLHTTKPRLKIIFASGYSMDDLDTSFSARAGAVPAKALHARDTCQGGAGLPGWSPRENPEKASADCFVC